jgi:hypothetical protein
MAGGCGLRSFAMRIPAPTTRIPPTIHPTGLLPNATATGAASAAMRNANMLFQYRFNSESYLSQFTSDCHQSLLCKSAQKNLWSINIQMKFHGFVSAQYIYRCLISPSFS